MSPPDSPILGPDGQPIGPSSGGASGDERAEPRAEGGASGEEAAAAHRDKGAGAGSEQTLPEANLTLHVFHLASQVAMALGEAENPITGQRETDLRAARFLIDTIEMLEQKTQGNRTPEEDEYLGGVLTNLRMAYVQKSG